jgi:hypothetical protein
MRGARFARERDDEEGAMTVPAGWYDDGSGRQRWWDGTQWTEHFAPVESAAQVPDAGDAAFEETDLDATVPRRTYTAPTYTAPAYTAPAYTAPAYTAPAYTAPAYTAPADTAPAYATVPEEPKTVSVLGFVGFGLAVLGTILACIPIWFTLIPGLVILFAALVISTIAVFRKNTRKWPAITGIALSVVGGIIGIAVAIIMLFVTTMTAVVTNLPTTFPTPMSTDDPGAQAGRPLPEQITAGFLLLVADQEDIEAYTEPGVAACIGEHLYDSALSDEILWDIATATPLDDEALPAVEQASNDAADACTAP